MKFTIRHVVYVIKQSVSPKMFTNERLFTIQAFTITRVHCINFNLESGIDLEQGINVGPGRQKDKYEALNRRKI